MTSKYFIWIILLLWGSSALASYLPTPLYLLKQLLHTDDPPKGHPFPSIAGPDPDDKVCIVGAGSAGIHMAVLLKRLGYEHITIFEKTNRVGGKSFDINYDKAYVPLGTVFGGSNYHDDFIPLANDYGGLGERVPLTAPNAWETTEDQCSAQKLSGRDFLKGNQTLPDASSELIDSALKYATLHKDMFGDYEGFLMPEPTNDVLHKTRGTFYDFLEREDLLALVKMFRISNELQGYGYLDEISALYGLMWNNPRFLISLVLRFLGQILPHGDLYSFVMKKGFEIVWNTIYEEENLDVRFYSDIVSLTRRPEEVILTLQEEKNYYYGWE